MSLGLGVLGFTTFDRTYGTRGAPMAHMAHYIGYQLSASQPTAPQELAQSMIWRESVPSLPALVDHVAGHARPSPFERDFALGDEENLPPCAADLAEVKGVNTNTKG